MANTIRIKRRASGSPGAPASLENAELAFNEVDDVLYYGKGTGGAGGTATVVEAIGGKGAVVMLSGNQSIGGIKTFNLPPKVPTPAAADDATPKAWVEQKISEVGLPSASQPANTVFAAPSGSAGAPAFRLLAAQDIPDLSATYQPKDAELTALASLVSAANKIPRFTGSGTASLLDFSTDGTLSANSDTVLVSQKAIKTYVDGLMAANDAMVFKGVINASANPNYPAGNAGDTYRISVAGKIGGASGPNVEVGDILICTADGTAAGTHATVGASWTILQVNIDGALTVANIGVSVQAYDAGLQSIAGLATAANQGLYLTAADAYATYSLTAGGRALAAVAGTANTFPYFSASNTVTLASITAAGRAVLAAADAAAQRTALGLGTMATQNANAVNITGGSIDNIVFDGGTF